MHQNRLPSPCHSGAGLQWPGLQWVGIFHNCTAPLALIVKAVDMVDAVPFLMVLRMQKGVLRR